VHHVGIDVHKRESQIRLPLAAQPLDRRRRQRRALAQQSAHCQLEVVLRESVQVRLRQQRAHLAALPCEQRQHLALEALVQVARARPSGSTQSEGRVQVSWRQLLSMAGEGLS
jgi:hypothetical protein